MCAEGGLVACKGCGCTERSVFQTLRGAAGKNRDCGGGASVSDRAICHLT